MANATNIAAKEYINGSLYYNWISLSSSWTPLYAGKLNDGDNYVLEFRFTLASATTAINLSWCTTGDTNKGRPMYYKLLTAENSSYNNATNSNHGDGTLNTTAYGYTSQSNTITGTFQAGTYYLYMWQGATYGSDTYIHTSVFFSNASYPFSITYTAVNSYTLTASVGTGVSFTATISSSPYGRSGTVSSGGAVLQGEVLTLTYTVSTGYTIQTHTLNGTSFNSGASTGSVSSNLNIVLTAIQAVAVFNSVPSSYTTGTASTITVIRYSSSYTNSIEVIQGGTTRQTLSISWSGNNGTVSWTPSDATYAPLNTSGASVSVTIRLYTKSGGTTIGYKDAGATINFGTGVNPTPSVTVTDNNGYYSTFGAYVQGKSAFHVVVSDGLKYSASTTSRTTAANGSSYSASTFNTGVLNQSGTLYVSTTITDSRGKTGTDSSSGLTVLAYSAPQATTFSVRRTDSGGTPDESGGYFTVSWAVSITALNNNNARKYKIDYKLTSTNTWTSLVGETTLSSYTQSGTTTAQSVSTDSTYDVRFGIADSFGWVYFSTKLSTVPAVIDILDQGTGVSFGKVAETANALDAGSWNVIGRVRGLGQARGQILANGNYNDWVEPGVYGIASDYIAGSLSNAPDSLGGTLTVWNSLGDSHNASESGYYVIQEKTSHTTKSYRRKGYYDNGSMHWESWVARQEESSSGYCKLPEGTLIQWGQAGGYDGVTEKNFSVTMSYAFVDTTYVVSVTNSLGTISTIGSYDQRINTVVRVSTTEFTVHQRVLNGNPVNQFHWLAIGRWK